MAKLHFIAVGGAAMHNLAIALLRKGYQITGSDDEIFEPSLSRLRSCGLLPGKWGWHPEKISPDIDVVILGMHARADNPELLRAKELGLRICSYPEFLYEQTKNKKRVVIAGSHGKTTITALIIHVLTYSGWKPDFMVGSQIEGFENMVSLSDEAEIAVFEGDEYLSSPIDLRPKFIHYRPHIALISGIAWDHINVFPTFTEYTEQFRILTTLIAENGHLVYFNGDKNLKKIAEATSAFISKHPYSEHPAIIRGETTSLVSGKKIYPVRIFGQHNLQNISGAKRVCELLGLPGEDFYRAITSFPGTAKRLQKLAETGDFTCYLDFAHAPSKVRATLSAVKEQYPGRHITAVFELHTFSSLNKEFLPQYKRTLETADDTVVFYNEHVLNSKHLESLPAEFIRKCFGNRKLTVITDTDKLAEYIRDSGTKNTVLLLMSSGNFGGLPIKELLPVAFG